MSIKAMNWAWSQVLPPTSKLILMAIADSASDCGECWMSNATIARKCCVSERTVQRELAKFVSSKLITATPRYTTAGRQTSNTYRLDMCTTAYPDNLSPSPSKLQEEDDMRVRDEGDTHVRDGGDIAVSPLEPPNESSKEPLLQQSDLPPPLHYPKGLTTSQRRSIEAMTQGVSPDEAQALLDELADALETNTIRTNPLRWFSGIVRQQKAGNFVATGGIRIADRRQKAEARVTAHQDKPGVKIDSELARRSLTQIIEMLRSSSTATK